MATSENEEFEFRLRAEKEAQAAKKTPAPAATAAQPEENSTMKDILLSPFAGLETGLHAASNLVAPVAGNLAGLGVTAEKMLGMKSNFDDPDIARQRMQKAMTYEPRGTHAKDLAGATDMALSLPGKAVGLASKPIGSAIRGGAASDTARGALGNLTEEGINQGAGFLLGKGIKSIKGMTDTSAGAAAKAASEKAGQSARANEVRKMASDEGLVVPSSQAADTLMNNLKETAAGGGNVSQRLASLSNQPKFQSFVRKTLGLAEDQPISKDTLKELRTKQGEAYKDIEQWGAPFRRTNEFQTALKDIRSTARELDQLQATRPTANKIHKMLQDIDQNQIAPKQAMSLINILREEGKANLGSAKTAGGDTAKSKLGNAQMAGARALEDMVEKNLQYGGGQQLATAFKAAREKIAQSYTAEEALNPSTGEIDAGKLYDAMKRGDMVGGQMKKAADFAGAFPKASGVPSELGSHPDNIRRALTKPFLPKGAIAKPKPIQASPTVIQAINRIAGSNAVMPTAVGTLQPKGDSDAGGE